LCNGKGKGKLHPRTDHEVPDSVVTDTEVICHFKTQNPPKISNNFYCFNEFTVIKVSPSNCHGAPLQAMFDLHNS